MTWWQPPDAPARSASDQCGRVGFERRGGKRCDERLRGLGVNLMVRDVAVALPFHIEVLGAECLYGDEDFAALRHTGADGTRAGWFGSASTSAKKRSPSFEPPTAS